jgi:hypothetical protein
MRRLLLLLAALLIAYAAWPTWSAWQLRAAVKARDLASIEPRVDWPALRANLKQTLGASLRDENADAGAVTKAIKRTLGTLVADTVVDAAVTPSTLAHVLAGRVLMSEVVRSVPGRGQQDADEADPLSPRRLRWAFFESPTRFRIEMADSKEPRRRVVSVLELQGVAWKLVDVYYRSPA